MRNVTRIQGNIYYKNDKYPVKRGAPYFTSRGKTELQGDALYAGGTIEKFEKAINNHPAVNNFFEKYDGNFVIMADDGTSASSRRFRNKPPVMGRLGLRYINPLHQDKVQTEWFVIANGPSSNGPVDEVIEKMLSLNVADIPEKLPNDYRSNGSNGHDVLSLYLNYIDETIEIEKIKSMQEFLDIVRKTAVKEARKRYYKNRIMDFCKGFIGSRD